MTRIYQGAVGLRVRFDTNLPASTYTLEAASLRVQVQEPDGTTTTWACTQEVGADPIVIYHDTEAGDLDQVGAYVCQADVKEDGASSRLPLGESVHLEVHAPFQ